MGILIEIAEQKLHREANKDMVDEWIFAIDKNSCVLLENTMNR